MVYEGVAEWQQYARDVSQDTRQQINGECLCDAHNV